MAAFNIKTCLMQAYGGSLFDPDRYPFLEGRVPQSSWSTSPAEPLAVNNRVVLHLLNSLQRLQVKVGGGGPAETRRISFRALGVEQIGHVYEGLLDHTAERANEPVLGIKGTRHKETGDSHSRHWNRYLIQGEDKLIEFLKEETGRSLSALRHALDEVSLLDEHRLLIACGHDKKLLARLRPFASLIREDSFDRPLVMLTGSIYVTAGTTRRSTGTHYTPPSLTEPIVQHTLEPLVYEGPAEGVPREQWKLKSPRRFLDLKVCDMAMGSGAFLVQACRYLAERLVEAWENDEKQHPGRSADYAGWQVLRRLTQRTPGACRMPTSASPSPAVWWPTAASTAWTSTRWRWRWPSSRCGSSPCDANRPFNFLDHALQVRRFLAGHNFG